MFLPTVTNLMLSAAGRQLFRVASLLLKSSHPASSLPSLCKLNQDPQWYIMISASPIMLMACCNFLKQIWIFSKKLSYCSKAECFTDCRASADRLCPCPARWSHPEQNRYSAYKSMTLVTNTNVLSKIFHKQKNAALVAGMRSMSTARFLQWEIIQSWLIW